MNKFSKINFILAKKIKMKQKILYLVQIFIWVVCLQSITHAQSSAFYFCDREQKEDGTIRDCWKGNDCMYIAGNTFEKRKFMPYIMKIDTLGNIVWSTITLDTTISYQDADILIEKIMYSDNYIFGICRIETFTEPLREIWKVDATNGTIVWKKPYVTNYDQTPDHIVDYDSTKFLIAYMHVYTTPSVYSNYIRKFAFINKNTGDSISTHAINTPSNIAEFYGFGIDHEKNIYFTCTDTIFKIDHNNLDSVVWRVQYPSADILDFSKIYFDSNDSLFLFGRKETYYQKGKVVHLNKNNGTLLWVVSGLSQDIYYSKMVDQNGKLYVTWNHPYYGAFWTTKIDKSSGLVDWNSSYVFTGVGTPISYYGNSNGANSIDIDNQGDLYLTGFYAIDNWGILKLDGSTGNPIYEATITEDSLMFDEKSKGLFVCVLNNSPYCFGELQTIRNNSIKRSTSTFVKIDGSTGLTLIKKYIGGNYQFPSKTIDIIDYKPDKTIVLKQVGRFVYLEVYDFHKNIIWEKKFTKEYYLFGTNVTVSPNGNIFMSAYTNIKANIYPYHYSYNDNIFVYQLDSLGNQIWEKSFSIGSYNTKPIELYADNDCVFVFYQDPEDFYPEFNKIHFRKITYNSISPDINTYFVYPNLIARSKICENQDSSKIFIFGDNYSNWNFQTIDKNTLTFSHTNNIPAPLNVINYVQKIDTNLVFLTGKNYQNNESFGIFNTLYSDTIWTKKYSISNSQAIKGVIDDQKQYIYMISHSNNNILIRKLAVLDGQESWQYEYNGSSNLDDFPTDISYDNYRGQVIVSGYETENSNNKKALILVLDSLGSVISTNQFPGDFNGNNYALCTKILPDGSNWVGGNLNTYSYGLAGFIFEMDSSIYSNVDVFLQSDIDCVSIFPNPFTSQTTIKFNRPIEKGKLILYNSIGNKILELNDICEQTITLYGNNLSSGLYIMKVWENNHFITSKKIILFN
jgi:hypothetical protein